MLQPVELMLKESTVLCTMTLRRMVRPTSTVAEELHELERLELSSVLFNTHRKNCVVGFKEKLESKLLSDHRTSKSYHITK